MTDARFPERWLNDRRYMSLSGPDFRAFVCTLTWSVASRTDGVVRHADLDLMAWMTPEIADRLAANEVLVPIGEGWLIDGFAVTQTSRKQLEALDAKHAADAQRKREDRLQRKMHSDNSAGQQDVRVDVQQDDTRTRTRTRPLPEQPLSQVRAAEPAADPVPSLPTSQRDNGKSDRCVVDGCGSSPRHGLRTCFEHAGLEFAS